jgi:uncharacterized pyridoxal phosphate-containing UPF0001 family protein
MPLMSSRWSGSGEVEECIGQGLMTMPLTQNPRIQGRIFAGSDLAAAIAVENILCVHERLSMGMAAFQ